jgi:hypothetical protein
VTLADDLHALRLERKWWLHRAALAQARIDALELPTPVEPTEADVRVAAGCALAVAL